jgi:hypothetical protein
VTGLRKRLGVFGLITVFAAVVLTVSILSSPEIAVSSDGDEIDFEAGTEPMPDEIGEDLPRPVPVAPDDSKSLRPQIVSLMGDLPSSSAVAVIDPTGVRLVSVDEEGSADVDVVPGLPGREFAGFLLEKPVVRLPVDQKLDDLTAGFSAQNLVGSSVLVKDLTDDGGQVLTWTTVDGATAWRLDGVTVGDEWMIPLVVLPEGGFLVAAGDGTYGLIGAESPKLLSSLSDLPPAWSGASGPGSLLALGLTTRQVVVGSPGVGWMPLAGLPSKGPPIDIVWDKSSALFFVNIASPTVRDSGVYACDVPVGECVKVVEWEPEMRLAEIDLGQS